MPSFMKTGRQEVSELAWTPNRQTDNDRLTESQTDTSTDNKGCLSLQRAC